MIDRKQMVEELKGTKCRCGKKKRAKETFCGICYYSLPRQLRLRLYCGFGSGYEEVYQKAVEHLDAKEKEEA